jgi:hypothetical protein
VRVTELVRHEAAPNSRLRAKAAELDAHARCRPDMAAGRPVDHAEQRPDRQLDAELEPGPQLLEASGVHADLAPRPALAAAHEQRAATAGRAGARLDALTVAPFERASARG